MNFAGNLVSVLEIGGILLRSKWAAGEGGRIPEPIRDPDEQWFKAAPLQMDRADRRRKCEIPGAEEGKFIEMLRRNKTRVDRGSWPDRDDRRHGTRPPWYPRSADRQEPVPDTASRAIGNPGAYAWTLEQRGLTDET